jgi:hypothetical protein
LPPAKETLIKFSFAVVGRLAITNGGEKTFRRCWSPDQQQITPQKLIVGQTTNNARLAMSNGGEKT